MNTKKLKDGTLIVPFASSNPEFIGDGYKTIKPGHPEYEEHLRYFEKQEELERKLQEIAKKNPEYKDNISDW